MTERLERLHAILDAARADVGPHRAHDGHAIDAGVVIEAAVLDSEECLRHIFG